MSAVLYLLHVFSYIRTWSNLSVKHEQIFIIFHVLSYFWTCFFELGWRLSRFAAAYPDGEMSANSYLLPVFSYIWTCFFELGWRLSRFVSAYLDGEMSAGSYLLSVFFMLGWRFCGFWSSYPDHEVSTNSYLLHAHSYIRTWRIFPVKLEQIYIRLHGLSYFESWSNLSVK